MLADAPLGRSHRAAVGKSKLAEAIDLTREIPEALKPRRIEIAKASPAIEQDVVEAKAVN